MIVSVVTDVKIGIILPCTELDDSSFNLYCIDKTKIWVCNKCINSSCSKCNLPFKKGASICCDHCNNWLHLKCSGLLVL